MTKVLVVEDDVIIAEDLKSKLEKLKYEVTDIVYNGDHVFDSLRRNRPDLILLDIHLKGTKTGIDLGHMINDRHKIPFLYITSFSDANTIEEVKKTKPYGYIVKPFSIHDIQVNLEMAIFNINRYSPSNFPDLILINAHLNISLTKTEFSVILKIKEGLTNELMAKELFVSVNTIKTHIRNIYEKCNVNSKQLLIEKLWSLSEK